MENNTINFFKNLKKFSLNEIILSSSKHTFTFNFPYIKQKRFLKLYFNIKFNESNKIDSLSQHISFKYMILAVAISPDQKYLALGLEDHSIQIWNIDHSSKDFCTLYKVLNSQKNQTDLIQSVCYSNDGSYLASTNHNRAIILWNTKVNTKNFGLSLKRMTNGGLASFKKVCFAKAENILVSINVRDYILVVWNVNEDSPDFGKIINIINSFYRSDMHFLRDILVSWRPYPDIKTIYFDTLDLTQNNSKTKSKEDLLETHKLFSFDNSSYTGIGINTENN